LTGDENIVDVELVSQYRIKDANSYLFMTADPDDTVRQLTESSIREIIGTSNFDFVITEGRGEIAVQAQERIQQILDRYNAGIEVTSVNMQPAKPPDEVKASFDDAIKSREDEQRKINEAEAYRNEVVERAQGEAHRLRLESEAYREQVIARATGEARRFGQILVEYRKAPAVTRKRLYLEAIESVLSDTTKVMIDAKQSNNLTYLPLDRILNNAESARQSRDPAPQSGNSVTAPTADFGSSAARSREVR
jgi:membrane protease subunit HflK